MSMFDSYGLSTSVGLIDSPTHAPGPSESRSVRQPSVLLVDDDADSLILLSFIFEQFSCLVVSETDGKNALERIERTRFDLIMLDIQLPGLSGLDVVRTLRATPLNASLPVVAVTAMAREKDREEAVQAGCDRYITKPYLLEDIEVIIGQYITRRP